jgi:hypothetical protein
MEERHGMGRGSLGSTAAGKTRYGELYIFRIEIEIEIVYNMYRMRRLHRLLSLGPPNYAIQGIYKSGLDR